MILKVLMKKGSISKHDLIKDTHFPPEAVSLNLEMLERDGLIVEMGNSISIA